jgi:hypothetical protein
MTRTAPLSTPRSSIASVLAEVQAPGAQMQALTAQPPAVEPVGETTATKHDLNAATIRISAIEDQIDVIMDTLQALYADFRLRQAQ